MSRTVQHFPSFISDSKGHVLVADENEREEKGTGYLKIVQSFQETRF